MGAEQSSVAENETDPSTYSELFEVGQCSPQFSSKHANFPPSSENQHPRANSLLTYPRWSSNPMLNSPSVLPVSNRTVTNCYSPSRNHQPKRSMSVTTNQNSIGGIVTVCPGPMLRRHSSMSGLSSDPYNNSQQLLHRLQQIPHFYPLRNSSSFVKPDTNSPSSRPIVSDIYSIDVSKFVTVAKSYREYVVGSINNIHADQMRIIGLYNKLDYELGHLDDHMKAREKGVISSPQRRLFHKSPPTLKPNLSGVKQVDDFVLQTSQVSGIISQCSVALQHIVDALNSLNNQLPLSEQLSPLILDLSSFR